MSSSDLLRRMAELSILPGVKLGPSHSVEESVAEDIKAKVSKVALANKSITVVKRRKKSFHQGQAEEREPEATAEGGEAFEAGPAPGQGSKESAATQPEMVKANDDKEGQPPAQGEEQRPRTVKLSPGKYDKATIIGVQEIHKPADHRGNLKLPGAGAEKSELPDFMKLSPTKAQAGPAEGAILLAPKPESTDPSGPRPETGITLVTSAPPQAPGSASPSREPGQEASLAPAGTQGETGPEDDSQSPKDQPPKRRGDRTGTKVTRDLTQGRTFLNEPAKVIGVATFSTDRGRPGAPGAPRPTGPSRFPARQTQGLRPLPTPPGGASKPGAAIGRPEQPSGDTGTTRKRGAKRKKGAFTDRGQEDIKVAKRRDYLVERTDIYAEGSWERTRGKKPKSAKKTQAKTEITVPKAIKRRIKVDEVITVSELAHRLSLKVGDIIKKLMSMGVMAGLNQSLDFDTATLVAAEFGYDVEKSAFDEGDYLPVPDVADKYPLIPRPPVVTIMGHVDHGKTSLLDYIRETKIQEGEAGGITQHIGAYHVKVGQRYITFLDTPGHEAFTAMRSRGAQVTDIVILIVAADDGVMPQTKEAADHAKAAKVPIIVAVNKIDKPGADPERIRRQMVELGLTQEAWGGSTVFVDISAKTGQGVEELLEMILLQADLLELKAREDGPAKGRIIEARLDKGRGAMATVLVGEGTLKQGDTYVCGVYHGKIRAMFDDKGQKIEKAGPAIPIEIQGISGIPLAGDEFIVMDDERQAKQVSQHRHLKQRESVLVKTSKLTLENLFDHIKAGAIKGLNLIIKADVQGSLEAILDAIGKFSTPEIKITVIHSAIGVVTETDIMLASASNALIICFGVKPPSIKVQEVAESEQVQIRYYDVIYKLLEDIKEAMAGLLDPIKNVKVIGQVEVRAIFNITKVGKVAGCFVTDGKVTRGARAKLYRDKEAIYDGKVASLKREKNDVREVLAGYECGLGLDGNIEIKEGDRIEVYQIEETAATVDLINEAVERAAAQAASEAKAAQAEATK
ncbi:MAG: translation initiation factor IF-2 [Deltaproteobacteria bacterium]|jgi:translation initiation factor IF-2|nr:translation initiation factor IF-2 [Deltaproteobacteria bacterium]